MIVQYLPDVRNFLIRWRLPAADVDDLLQEAAARALQARELLPPHVDPKLWLLGVAKNVVREHRRATARAARLDEDEYRLAREQVVMPEGDDGAGCDAAALHRAVSLLPPKLRDAVESYHFRGMSAAQASAAVGCTPAALRQRLACARQRLHAILTEATKKDF